LSHRLHFIFTGLRSPGTGLVGYFLHFCFTKRVGVHGHDPILGALSPPLRVGIHVAACLYLWALYLLLIPIVTPTFAVFNWETSTATSIGLLAFLTYALGYLAVQTLLPGVSDPGPPRAHKIQRQPKWNNVTTHIPNNKWRCVVAQESHQATKDRVGVALMGEPAGRDSWTTATTTTDDESIVNNSNNNDLIEQLARGGRPAGFNAHLNPNSADVPFRAQMIRAYVTAGNAPPTLNKAASIKECLHKAVHFYSMLQTSDGHWSGDYGGPLFLMPGFIVAWYIMGKPTTMFDADDVELMRHYVVVHQQADGGWGTHIESPSTMFGTTMNYVALRLLGVERDDAVCDKARAFMLVNGGAIMTSSWAKLYLCLLGCMHWDGHNSVPPEMWLLPNWFPFHPSRMWCHARMVYLPMGFLYGSRFVYDKAETDPLILSLRKELYCEPYATIPWFKTRHLVAPMDNYSPINPLMKCAQDILARYETWQIFQPFKNWIRKRGLAFCVDYMAAEDLQTNFIDIGPVNKVLNMIAAYVVAGCDTTHTTVANHIARVPDYLWVAEDGMKVKGYNGSQCWDTSFAIQAIYEADLLDEFPELTKKVWGFLERTQILSTQVSMSTPAFQYETAVNRKTYYRHMSEGGWPFSTSAHGWPISDCTGEGLKGALCLLQSKAVKDGIKDSSLVPITEQRLRKAVNVLLTYQNEDGGWATYENNRGYGWYEWLNPSEVFGDIMIDYSYVECSVASLTALVEFRKAYPKYQAKEIQSAIQQGRDFVKSIQRADGSWYGNWACCFCYGVWFGIEGLVKCGEPTSSPVIKKACDFLLCHQRPNGGWGEDFTSCYDKDYAANGMEVYGDEGSGVVNTAWALLALSAAKCDNVEAVKRGIRYLMQRQLPSGDWPQEGIAGVFNRACGITYTAYRNVFPIWALGRCREVYDDEFLEHK
jgi:squalene/oxidosqualene cyclase-like protein